MVATIQFISTMTLFPIVALNSWLVRYQGPMPNLTIKAYQ